MLGRILLGRFEPGHLLRMPIAALGRTTALRSTVLHNGNVRDVGGAIEEDNGL